MRKKRLMELLKLFILQISFFSNSAGASSKTENSFRRITGVELERYLSGKTIVPNKKIQQRTPRFSEAFASNKNWLGILQSVELVMLYGKWSVEHGELCVQPEEKLKECRLVWQNNHDKSIFLLPILAWGQKRSIVEVTIQEISKGQKDALRRR
ncbi:MAG: hypothetical protein JWL66_1686 [Sphingomonadales bacterium]|nr:hypothetical protein [Sphingomonadales bacterium]